TAVSTAKANSGTPKINMGATRSCRSHRHSRLATSQNPRFGAGLIDAGAKSRTLVTAISCSSFSTNNIGRQFRLPSTRIAFRCRCEVGVPNYLRSDAKVRESGIQKRSGDEESWMPNQVTARLHKFLGTAREGHGLHAPFRVTTHHGLPSSKAPAPPSSWQGDLVPIGFDSNHPSAPPPSQRAGAKSGDDVVAFGREEVAVEWPRDACAAGKASHVTGEQLKQSREYLGISRWKLAAECGIILFQPVVTTLDFDD